MILDEILKKNDEFSYGAPVDAGIVRGIIIFTCSDSRLVGFLEQAMGLDRGDVAVIKNAGLLVTDDVIRSIAFQLFNFDVQELLVIGHTDCLVAKLKSYEFTEAMKKKGVPREAIPSGDLRGWIGAASSERERVRESVEAIRKSPLMPKDLLIHGLIMDTNTGALEVIVKGVTAAPVMAVAAAAAAAGAMAVEQKSPSILDRPLSWAKEKVQEAKDKVQEAKAEVHQAGGTVQSAMQWAKETAKEAKDTASQVKQDAQDALAGKGSYSSVLSQSAQALNQAAFDIKQGSTFDWSFSQDAMYQPRNDAFSAVPAVEKAEERAKGWYEKGVEAVSQAASQGAAFTTQKIEAAQVPGLSPATDAALEHFELWLEDLGVFNDEVKKEIKRITGVSVDDYSAIKKAILSTRSPQEAQRIKKQLQALGASAIIRRVKKLLK
jgi:carbonic anhydrase